MSYSKQALSWAGKNLIGKSVYHPELKKKIHFTRQGVKHAVSARSNRKKAAFIYDVKGLLKNSVLIDIQKDKKGRKQIKNIYIFFSEWTFEGKKYFAKMLVREGVNGSVYYDHVIIKKKSLD